MILSGPAGNAAGGDTAESVSNCRKRGLGAQEIEFVRQVYLKKDEARKVGKLAKELGMHLSIHGSYFVNLASLDKDKAKKSQERILLAVERGHELGAKYVVFHPAYYMGRDKEQVYKIVKQAVQHMMSVMKKKGWDDVKLAPETTGKGAQFGDVDELIRLSKETGCSICIDFAHLEARTNQKVDYDALFKKLKRFKHLHCHFSGIEYTEKGEKRHLMTPLSKIKELIKAMKKHKVNATIINESPDPLKDALKTQKVIDGR